MAQSHSETLALVLEMGQLLSSELDINELLNTVLRLASRVVEAETGSLLLLDEPAGELYFDVALGLGESAAKVRLKLGQGIAGVVARTRRSEIINEPRKDARWSPKMDQTSGFTTRSILAVPMLYKGRLIGVVEAINKKAGSFTEDDLRLYEAFASQAAVAIENARLFSSLKEEKSKLGTMFSEMADGAVLCAPDGNILLVNAAARRLLGLGEKLGTLDAGLAGTTVVPPLAEIIAERNSTRKFTATRLEPKELILAGTVVNLSADDPLALDGKAAQRGWLVVFRDETEERKQAKVKRTFLSLISHKLKTPLAAVVGFSDILLDDFKDDPPSPMAQKAAQTIAEQGKKLSDLVDRLLRYTVLDNPDHAVRLEPVGLDAVVAEALKDMQGWLAERGAAVEYKGDPAVTVIVDQDQMKEVVKNLLENGVKFDKNAQKKIRAWVETRRDGAKKAVLRVKDDGPGIPPEDQEKIFSGFNQVEAFFTGQIDGLGLGLPFVKKVVERHGGRLELDSKLGAGSTFSIVLPRVDP